ncbi:SEC-C metal-binding domain-containing protein [Bacillus thuringiensis]
MLGNAGFGPCNSGKKYKFCCMNKEIELNI